MKVWIGYYCYDTGADTFRKVEKVFDDEVKAYVWVADKEFNENAAHDFQGHRHQIRNTRRSPRSVGQDHIPRLASSERRHPPRQRSRSAAPRCRSTYT